MLNIPSTGFLVLVCATADQSYYHGAGVRCLASVVVRLSTEPIFSDIAK